MKKLKLVALKIDENNIIFKNGLNYIVGNNSSGKTVVFNCIRYALGLDKSIDYRRIKKINLEISIGGEVFTFSRSLGDKYININFGEEDNFFIAKSNELDDFYKNKLFPEYIYGSETESLLPILDSCFLSEERSVNRSQSWDVIKSICGVNSHLVKFFYKNIKDLTNEVSRHTEIENAINSFSDLLSVNVKDTFQEIDDELKIAKKDFFKDFEERKILLSNAKSKFDEINEKSNYELNIKLTEIENEFISLKNYLGVESTNSINLEAFAKGHGEKMSYGEELTSRFLLVLSIAIVADKKNYNFPSLIVNDSYLSLGVGNRLYEELYNFIKSIISVSDNNIQYVEFTYTDDIPKENIILNLNDRGFFYDFNS